MYRHYPPTGIAKPGPGVGVSPKRGISGRLNQAVASFEPMARHPRGLLCALLLGCGPTTDRPPSASGVDQTASVKAAASRNTPPGPDHADTQTASVKAVASSNTPPKPDHADGHLLQPAAVLPRRSPESAGFRPGAMGAVDALLTKAITRRAFPGAVVAIGRGGALVHLKGYGHLSYAKDAASVDAHTIYDLASLTKVVVTTTAAMLLIDEGKLSLSDRVVDHLPGFVGKHKHEVTVGHLLSHSSGIDWWAPLYEQLTGKAAYVAHIEAMDLVYRPGSKSLYSDLGIILLGAIIERVAGQDLDVFAQKRIFAPLAMSDTSYRPPADLHGQIAPTENDPWRGRVLRGEVHDENAYAMGGVAPHAGVFATAGDLAQFAQMMLGRGTLGTRQLVAPQTVEAFTKPAGIPGSGRAYGWDTPSRTGSSAGNLSHQSFGHTGFTGTSLWIDPTRKLFVILLTNRVHPTRKNTRIRDVRPALANAVIAGLEPQQ